MKWLLIVAIALLGCGPAPAASTGIVHDPGERTRDLAALQEEAARRRDAEADAADRAALQERLLEKQREEEAARRLEAEEAERTKAARAARCASERGAHEAAVAGLEAEVAKARTARERRDKAEKWIKANCRMLAHKVFSTELTTDTAGRVHRRQVQTGTEDPFQACPAKTPQDVAAAGGLSYDDDTGWTRTSIPPMPPKAEDFRARRTAEIAAMSLPDCD